MTRSICTVVGILMLWLAGTSAYGETLRDAGAATVISIVDGDTVILDRQIDGSARVRLVGIQAPKLPLGRKNFKKWPLADASKSSLEELLLNKRVTLRYGGQSMDRYGRLLAHVFTDDGVWAQAALLSAGMARVYSFPDNRSVVADMLALEVAARRARQGIWDHWFYAVRVADKVDRLIGTFQLVEGTVFDAQTVKGKTYLNFTADWRQDFTVSINRKAAKLFAASGLDPLTLKGRTIRVRGWIKKRNGPLIEASHPEQIEIIGQ